MCLHKGKIVAIDPNGNTLSKTKAGVTTTFLYDIRDQLGEVRQDTSILGRYGYDYNRRRILKLGDDGVRRYSYDQLSVITEADVANATVSKYDYGLDQLVGLDNTVEGRSFFHLDILRSTVSLSDAAGSTRQSIFYDAWGNERDRVGTSANKFTFTGHEKDEETGLIYAKARFYDPDVGRFLSQDGFLGDAGSPPSLHRYTYVMQNPFRFMDPTGNQASCVTEECDRSDLFQAGISDTAALAFGSIVGTAQFAGNTALGLVAGGIHLVRGAFGNEESIQKGEEFLDNAQVFLAHPVQNTIRNYHTALDNAAIAISQDNFFEAGRGFTEDFAAPNATLAVSIGAGTAGLVRALSRGGAGSQIALAEAQSASVRLSRSARVAREPINMGRLVRRADGVHVPAGHPSLGPSLAPSTPTALVPTTVSTVTTSASSALVPAGSFSRAIGASSQGQLAAGSATVVAVGTLVQSPPQQLSLFPDSTKPVIVEGKVQSLHVVRYAIQGAPSPPLQGVRQTGIDRAWRLEVELIRRTGRGSRDWTSEEIMRIRGGEFYRDLGYTGHHINRVQDAPAWKGDPRNIQFLKQGKGEEHMAFGHPNGTRAVQPPGLLIDRESMLRSLGGGVVDAPR